MATKRYTDATKWSDPWFQELQKDYKFLWMYLLDKCDHAGIYRFSRKQLEFDLDMKLDVEEMKNVFNGRVIILDNEKWFIYKFVKFQYGQLNPQNSCHKSVIKILKEYGLYERVTDLLSASKVVDTSLLPPSEEVRTKCAASKDKDQYQDNDKDQYKDTDKDQPPSRRGALDPIAETFQKALSITNEKLSLTTERRRVLVDVLNNKDIGIPKFMLAVKNLVYSSWPTKSLTYFLDNKFDAINRVDRFANAPPVANGNAPPQKTVMDAPPELKEIFNRKKNAATA